MPRFFIHVHSNGHCRSYDEFGLDFPNVERARNEVLRAAQDLISVFAARDQDPRDHAVEIANEAGEVVLHLPFSEVFLRDFDGSAGAPFAFPPGCGNGRGEQDGAT